jgi:tripeptide aminopeptidase
MQVHRLLENCAQIQAIAAPTFHERQRAMWMESAFGRLGILEVIQDDIWNVYAQCGPSNDRPVVVSAHLDTVFPLSTDLTLSRGPARWTGPGIGDNALGLAALLELASDLRASPAGNVWLVCTVGEEGLGNLQGMQRVVDRFQDHPLAYLALEGMSFGHVLHRAIPVARLRVEAHTSGGHAWSQAGDPSALHVLAGLAHQAVELGLPSQPKTTLNIGRMEGGSAINAIASHAWMEVEVRSESQAQLQRVCEALAHQSNQDAGPGVHIRVEQIGARPAGALPPDHPLVEAACTATRLTGGVEPRLTGGSTDASLPISLGYPAVCVGITTGRKAHAIDECIDLAPLASGYSAALDLIRRACRLSAV